MRESPFSAGHQPDILRKDVGGRGESREQVLTECSFPTSFLLWYNSCTCGSKRLLKQQHCVKPSSAHHLHKKTLPVESTQKYHSLASSLSVTVEGALKVFRKRLFAEDVEI